MSNIPQGNSTTPVNDALDIPADKPYTPRNYMAMWDRLRNDMRSLKAHDCTTIHPVLVLKFMDYIEEVEKK